MKARTGTDKVKIKKCFGVCIMCERETDLRFSIVLEDNRTGGVCKNKDCFEEFKLVSFRMQRETLGD